ncbi:50S ribosomal protein L21 [Propionibacterium freudenreichii]|nr:50S ribosomal protein L21 [Propionibacterium freudenreichii]
MRSVPVSSLSPFWWLTARTSPPTRRVSTRSMSPQRCSARPRVRRSTSCTTRTRRATSAARGIVSNTPVSRSPESRPEE